MSNGYFSIPRSLTTDPLWQELPLSYQHVFLVIVELACFKPRKFDDHGKIIDLLPGQLCMSERDLLKKCNKEISYNDVHRAIVKFKKYDFVKQEVKHRKNVLTITHKDTYDLINRRSEAESDANLKQTRSKLEAQTKNVRTQEHKNNTSSTYVTLEDKENFELELFKKNEEAMKNEIVVAFVHYCGFLKKTIEPFEFAKWLKFWDKDRVERNLVYSINKKTNDLTAYVQRSIMEDYASTEKEKKNETSRNFVSGKVHSLG